MTGDENMMELAIYDWKHAMKDVFIQAAPQFKLTKTDLDKKHSVTPGTVTAAQKAAKKAEAAAVRAAEREAKKAAVEAEKLRKRTATAAAAAGSRGRARVRARGRGRGRGQGRGRGKGRESGTHSSDIADDSDEDDPEGSELDSESQDASSESNLEYSDEHVQAPAPEQRPVRQRRRPARYDNAGNIPDSPVNNSDQDPPPRQLRPKARPVAPNDVVDAPDLEAFKPAPVRPRPQPRMLVPR